MRCRNPRTGWQAVADRLLVVLCALGFVVVPVGPVRAAWFDDSDLSLAPGGLSESVRLPVPGNRNGSLAGLVPYVTLGGPGLMGEAPAPTGSDRYQSLAGPTAPRVDLGAGLRLRLFDRLKVFGEYRLFQIRPAGESAADGLKRDSQEPALRGGLSFPF